MADCKIYINLYHFLYLQSEVNLNQKFSIHRENTETQTKPTTTIKITILKGYLFIYLFICNKFFLSGVKTSRKMSNAIEIKIHLFILDI